MIIIKLNNYNVVIKNEQCNINDHIVHFNDDDYASLYRIIRTIKDDKVSEEYIVVDDKTLYFNNPKPYSYIELKEFLGGIYDRH